MIRQQSHHIAIATRGRGFYEFTREAARLVSDANMRGGLAAFFIQHTSASLLIQENADPEVRRDLERFLSRLVPDGDPLFQHVAEGDDDMAAHLRTALTSVSQSVPIVEGRLGLGTWQGLYLWEHRLIPHHRDILVCLIGE